MIKMVNVTKADFKIPGEILRNTRGLRAEMFIGIVPKEQTDNELMYLVVGEKEVNLWVLSDSIDADKGPVWMKGVCDALNLFSIYSGNSVKGEMFYFEECDK